VLKSPGVQGVFFLCTSLVGSNYVPWWDRIAYITKTSKRPRFELRYPGPLSVDFRANGVEISLREILKLYKWPQNTDGERFVAELREACQGDEPPGAVRRFLDWGEAGAMLRGGMAIGSHTQTHPVLSQLDEDKQREELSAPRAVLKERLGIDPDALAYPVGARTSFSHVTERLAQDLGYRIAFSYHGGVNLPGVTRPYDVKRVAISSQSTTHFRVQTGVCRVTGKYWP
jgi:peptidoglycan/xylan/chitin deacetylase (PgdA/CDA1 family)